MFELRGIAISCSPDNLQEVMKGRQNIYLIIMRSFLKDYLFWLENNKFGLPLSEEKKRKTENIHE